MMLRHMLSGLLRIRTVTPTISRRLALAVLSTLTVLSPANAQGVNGGPVIEEYYLLDAVGSVRAVVDPQGNLLRRHDFMPFGDESIAGCGSTADPQLYAGKPRDRETCLDALGARYYQPAIGRLHGVDPVLQIDAAIADPQQWNRYAYALNNPYRFRDPDGRQWQRVAETLLNAVAASPVVVRATQMASQQSTAVWNWATGFFNSPVGAETLQTTAELLTGGNAGPSPLAGPRLLGTPPDLPNAGGVIRSFVQEADQIYYRAASDAVSKGRFVTAVPPRSAAWAGEALSLPRGNTAAFVQEVLVPAGTRMQRSRALKVPAWGRLRGGAEQFELLDILPDDNFRMGRPVPK